MTRPITQPLFGLFMVVVILSVTAALTAPAHDPQVAPRAPQASQAGDAEGR